MTKTIPWAKIKTEYLQGATPKDLAKKYKLTARQISNKVYAENWGAENKKIQENIRQTVADKIKNLSNNALEVLNEVMNDPKAKDADKVSAAKAILDVSGLKTQKQEITGDIKTTNPVINILPVKANDKC